MVPVYLQSERRQFTKEKNPVPQLHILPFTLFSILKNISHKCSEEDFPGGAKWLRIRLPMQGTRVQALVREDSYIPWSN